MRRGRGGKGREEKGKEGHCEDVDAGITNSP